MELLAPAGCMRLFATYKEQIYDKFFDWFAVLAPTDMGDPSISYIPIKHKSFPILTTYKYNEFSYDPYQITYSKAHTVRFYGSFVTDTTTCEALLAGTLR